MKIDFRCLTVKNLIDEKIEHKQRSHSHNTEAIDILDSIHFNNTVFDDNENNYTDE